MDKETLPVLETGVSRALVPRVTTAAVDRPQALVVSKFFMWPRPARVAPISVQLVMDAAGAPAPARVGPGPAGDAPTRSISVLHAAGGASMRSTAAPVLPNNVLGAAIAAPTRSISAPLNVLLQLL